MVAGEHVRAAVVGGGVAGLVCALRLTESGHQVDVYERWPGLGGQAATLDVGGGTRLERYYHYLFTSDAHMIGLFEELGLVAELDPHPSNSAVFIAGRMWPFNGAADLLRFRPISITTRLRMGLALLRLQAFAGRMRRYEGVTAHRWITRHMGSEAWESVWGPLMRGKFGERAEQISMVWIWDKVGRRRNLRRREAAQEVFLYPRRSFEPLFQELAARIRAGGGRVLIDRPAAALGLRDGSFTLTPGARGSFRRGLAPSEFEPCAPETYDAVACCVPNHVFAELLDAELAAAVGSDYLTRLRQIEYFTALDLLLELDRNLTDRFWVNIADRRIPFVGVIEHTNFVGTEAYGGRHFVHLTNYLPADDELIELDPDALLEHYLPALRLLNPGFQRSWVRERWRFAEPAGQPIVTVGYRELIPPMQTPVPRLVLVNTTQIHPEDRGTNYAVRDGEQAARALAASAAAPRAATARAGT